MFYVNYKMILWRGTYQASVVDSLFHFHQPTQQLSLISSNPTRVCLCTNMSIPDCSITEHTITAYPGGTLTIPAVAVGQRFGTVPSTVHSNFVSGSSGRLLPQQYTQLVNVNCTDLLYTIHSSPNRTEAMELIVEKHTTALYHGSTALYHGSTALYHGSTTLYHGSTALYHGSTTLYHGSTSLYYTLPWL